MLRLTSKADYGLRLMLEVAAHGGWPVTTAEVARRHQIPHEFLRKLAQALVSHGLLLSQRGYHGGLILARPAEEITLLDVLRALGSLARGWRGVHPRRFDGEDVRAAYAAFHEAQREVERVLGAVRLSAMVGRHACPAHPQQTQGSAPASRTARPAVP